MLGYVLRRLGLVAITFLFFVLIHSLRGDPVEMMLGERGIDPERHAAPMTRSGRDLPLSQQYAAYTWRMLHGDLGRSLATHEGVLTEFLTLFPATVKPPSGLARRWITGSWPPR